jgi:hypothetical protein
MLFRALIQGTLLLAATVALAQNGGATPCREDAQKLCPEAVAAHDRQAAKTCLMQQTDKVSAACLAKLQEAQSK